MSEKVQPEQSRNPQKDHFFLRSELYDRCHICKGTLKIACGMAADGTPCPECTVPGNDHAGFCKIGMTVGQLERMHSERDELAVLLIHIEELIASGGTTQDVLATVAEAKPKMNRTTMATARLERSKRAMDAERAAKLASRQSRLAKKGPHSSTGLSSETGDEVG